MEVTISEGEKMNIDEAIKIIEEKSVYRCTAKCDDGSAFFVSTNGMPQTLWTQKQILELAEIMKNKPKGL